LYLVADHQEAIRQAWVIIIEALDEGRTYEIPRHDLLLDHIVRLGNSAPESDQRVEN
jgi:hypothetical protein